MTKLKRLMAAGLLLIMAAGCGAQKETPPAPEAEQPLVETPETSEAAEPEAAAPDRTTIAPWLPEGIELKAARTEHLPELAAVIAETYDIPEDAWEGHRYYYDYVDLNGDGDEEILAVVAGMYTSGSGGDSALLVQPYAGMNVRQTFTLVRMPVLIGNPSSGKAGEIIFLRGGGGSEPQLVRLTCTDGIYTNPADAEALESLDGFSGTAILGNDLAADLESGHYLTLAGPQ